MPTLHAWATAKNRRDPDPCIHPSRLHLGALRGFPVRDGLTGQPLMDTARCRGRLCIRAGRGRLETPAAGVEKADTTIVKDGWNGKSARYRDAGMDGDHDRP